MGGAAKVFQHRMLKVQRQNPVTCSHIVIRGNCWNLFISDTYYYKYINTRIYIFPPSIF